MAHWAEIDNNNKVIRVLVGDNNDPNGDEGYQWLIDNLGGRWIKTSYNHKIRGKFAAIGDTYDEEKDIFTSPQPPFPFIWDEQEQCFMPPIPYPDAGAWRYNPWTGEYEEIDVPPIS
jgi:hypothetical protein